jgi:hypothetical protein
MRWLLDLIAIVACVLWQRAREPRHPTTRLLGVGRFKRGVIAVLVSHLGMEDRLRRVLGERAALCFMKTWGELQDVVSCTNPLAVFADPLADETGNPNAHLEQICREARVPIILYTSLSPAVAGRLLALGQVGIRHLVFHQFDDNPERLKGVVDWGRGPPRNQPPLQVA